MYQYSYTVYTSTAQALARFMSRLLNTGAAARKYLASLELIFIMEDVCLRVRICTIAVDPVLRIFSKRWEMKSCAFCEHPQPSYTQSHPPIVFDEMEAVKGERKDQSTVDPILFWNTSQRTSIPCCRYTRTIYGSHGRTAQLECRYSTGP